jgi:hypothetical protein
MPKSITAISPDLTCHRHGRASDERALDGNVDGMDDDVADMNCLESRHPAERSQVGTRFDMGGVPSAIHGR